MRVRGGGMVDIVTDRVVCHGDDGSKMDKTKAVERRGRRGAKGGVILNSFSQRHSKCV